MALRHLSATAGTAPLSVTVELTLAEGEGACAFVHGGTLPHVGGVVLAAPGPELHGKILSRCDLWSVTVPGHKDGEAAAAVARKLCLALGQPISVTCGIHVDDATPQQIKLLGENCLMATDEVLSQLQASSQEALSATDGAALLA